MTVNKLMQIELAIEAIKSQLRHIGPMRPGSLTRQYRHPKEHAGAFFQLSYTRDMKSRTEYVRPEFVKDLRLRLRNYKKLKKLFEKWIGLGIEHSRLSMRLEIERAIGDVERRRKHHHG